MTKKICFQKLFCALMLVFVSLGAAAASLSDRAKEKRWEEQIVPDLFTGEAIKLKADGVEFLALYTETSADKPKGGVIVLHGIGVHPAWPDVIEPLRARLAERGWHTLSLQLPILENEATEADYAPLFKEVPSRIQAGVDFFKTKGVKNIAISAHSMGHTMASWYLASSADPEVDAFAITSGGIGVPADDRMDAVENFKNMKNIYIFDLKGSEDSDQVKDAWQQRGAVGNKIHGERYETQVITGANHFYNGKANELVDAVSAWLDKVMPD